MIQTPTFVDSNVVSTVPQGSSFGDIYYYTNMRSDDDIFSALISDILGGSLLNADVSNLAFGSPEQGGKRGWLDGTEINGDDTSLESLSRTITDGRTSSVFQEPITMGHGRAFRHVLTSDIMVDLAKLYARPNALVSRNDRSLELDLLGRALYDRRMRILISRYLFSYAASGVVLTTSDAGVTSDSRDDSQTGRSWAIETSTNSITSPESTTLTTTKKGTEALRKFEDVAQEILNSQSTDGTQTDVLVIVPNTEVSLFTNALRDESNSFASSANYTPSVVRYLGRNSFAMTSWAGRFRAANIIINAFGGEERAGNITLITCPESWMDNFILVPTTSYDALRDMYICSGTRTTFAAADNNMRYIMFDTSAVRGGSITNEGSRTIQETKYQGEDSMIYSKEAQLLAMNTRKNAVSCGYLNFGT